MHELIELYPNNTEYHVLLSNLYSSHGKHAESNDLWREIKRNKTRKGPGISYIEVDANVHQFTAGDKSHPRAKEIYSKLDEIVQRLRLAGYFPNAASQISRVEDGFLENGDAREQREQALLLHSERLAVAFGLVCTKPGIVIAFIVLSMDDVLVMIIGDETEKYGLGSPEGI
ncbi:uncharacterized protein A4U43_C07F20370 [Asparagus officinalis]|uniref:Uncharacterized protein n=1 Tax=Asparagus officinalis TaxID=4686 RepID=A0A5P1EGH2_ASPOF|nr:uncharacterized protein A4U43_C07F20370 [Asparagus officinalis]